MEYDELIAYALSLNGAYLDYPFGPEIAVIKVRALEQGAGKVFALLWPQGDTTRMNLKCDPVLAEQLRAVHPQVTPGYHMNKRHWNSLEVPRLDAAPRSGGLEAEIICNLIEDSYDLVVSALPKRDHILLDWRVSDQQ